MLKARVGPLHFGWVIELYHADFRFGDAIYKPGPFRGPIMVGSDTDHTNLVLSTASYIRFKSIANLSQNVFVIESVLTMTPKTQSFWLIKFPGRQLDV